MRVQTQCAAQAASPPPPSSSRFVRMRRAAHSLTFLVATLLAAALTLPASAQQEWTRTLYASDASSFSLYSTVATDSTAIWTGTIESSNNGQVRSPKPAGGEAAGPFLYPGVQANYSTLPASLAAYVSTNTEGVTRDLLTQVHDGVWHASLYASKPYRRFLTASFACSSTLPSLSFSDRATVCTALDSSFTITLTNQLSSKNGGRLYPIAITLQYASANVAQTEQVKADAMIVLFYQFASYTNQFTDIQGIESANTRRRNRARVAVGFLWFFAAMVMLFVLIIAATFQSWLYPLFPFPYALYIWIGLLIALTIGISIGTGIAGFLVLLFIYGAYSCVAGVVYYIHRLRNRETPPSVMENQALIAKNKAKEKDKSGLTPHLVSPKNRGVEAAVPSPDPSSPNSKRSPSTVRSDPASPVPVEPKVFNGFEDPDSEDMIHPYVRKPHRFGFIQRRFLGFSSMLFLTCFVLCVALFGIWRVDDYRIIDRQAALPQQPSVVEYIPQTIAKSVEAIYAFDGYATKLHLDKMFFHVGTEWCGAHYSSYLEEGGERQKAIYQDYIVKYKVDMTQYEPQDWNKYTSVNDWFIRKSVQCNHRTSTGREAEQARVSTLLLFLLCILISYSRSLFLFALGSTRSTVRCTPVPIQSSLLLMLA
jgi:hypothetical protein